MVVFTGPLAGHVGHALGIGSSAVTVWNVAKWPVLVVIVSLLFAILYWASPNAKHGGFRWVSPGAEFDAELQRSRAVQAGHDETDEPYMDLRDTRKLDTGRSR